MSEISAIDLARPDAPAYPPVEPFLLQADATAARWTAWLLLNNKSYDQDRLHHIRNRPPVTLRDIAQRLLMVAGPGDAPTPRQAFDLYDGRLYDGRRMFSPYDVINNISWDRLWRNDPNFPWLVGSRSEPDEDSAIGIVIYAINQPRDITDETLANFNFDWRQREELRFAAEIYNPLKWDLKPIPDHYAHISVEKEAMVAFTENPDKGARDIQTRIKPGRYLKKFYPDLSPEQINTLQATITHMKVGVQFATKAEEITKIYRTGPQSCMSYAPSQYSLSGQHPTEAYHECDLQIAYLVDKNGRYTARTQVWPEKQVYNDNIYGDYDKLKAGLKMLGYKPGSLDGARIRKLVDKTGKKYVVPAIDNNRQFTEDGDWLRITSGGPLDYGTGPGGSIVIPPQCSRCNARSAPVNVPNLGPHCDACLKELDVERCAGNGKWYRKEDIRDVLRRGDVTYRFGPVVRDNHAFFCQGSRKWYLSREFNRTTVDGKIWERTYADEHAWTDPDTGMRHAKKKEAA